MIKNAQEFERYYSLEALEKIAIKIRRHVLETISYAQVGHPGGSLSCVEILVALYFSVLKIDPSNPSWEGRDRFILSKGHAASALYSVLAERGFFSHELLKTFGKIDSLLQVHPDRNKTPGVEASTGALGQGLSIAVGMALGAKLDKKDMRIYCLIGDGESQEGQIWEAAMTASHYKLDNLTVVTDYNNVQLLGPVPEIMEVAPLAEKWRSFGWEVKEINGHNIGEIIKALEEAKDIKDKPSMIIAHTVKGKGISFMEGKSTWHGKAPNRDELKKALEELG